MHITFQSVSTYPIEGEFVEFLTNLRDEFKYLRLRLGERIITIKLAKELRTTVGPSLIPGDHLCLWLERTEPGLKSKLKTSRIQVINSTHKSLIAAKPPVTSPGKILICDGSGCSKRGGKELHQSLRNTLRELSLQDQVKIKFTGCQKRCKQAPNIILMPGGKKHRYVNTDNLASLLQAHYLSTLKP